MANSSGAPASAPTAQTPGTPPEKKRLFLLLGVGGVLALLVGGRLVMSSLNKGPTAATTTPTMVASNSVDTSASSNSVSGMGAGEGGLANAGIPPGGATLASADGSSNPSGLLPLARYRRDPFQPFYVAPAPTPIPPPPLPTPIPTPTPLPPVEIPPPIFLPPPGSGGGGGFGAPPGFAVPRPGGATNPGAPVILPQVSIPRFSKGNTSPTDAFPPPRSSSGGGANVTPPSSDKRLSGVVIGNGVRAILVIDNGQDDPKSYVVQPGDVVQGITVLNIRRFNEGGNQVTRMLIRENGGERFVDLKPGPARDNATGGGGSDSRGGSPGSRGGSSDPRANNRGGFGGG